MKPTQNDANWIKIAHQQPPQGLTVETKIDDERGPRNVQPLKLHNRLWFVPDMSVYVYYTPTHWRRLGHTHEEG